MVWCVMVTSTCKVLNCCVQIRIVIACINWDTTALWIRTPSTDSSTEGITVKMDEQGSSNTNHRNDSNMCFIAAQATKTMTPMRLPLSSKRFGMLWAHVFFLFLSLRISSSDIGFEVAYRVSNAVGIFVAFQTIMFHARWHLFALFLF